MVTQEDLNLLAKECPIEHVQAINDLSQYQMAYLVRFAPAGHKFFTGPTAKYFDHRFSMLGGMTPEISKQLGWDY